MKSRLVRIPLEPLTVGAHLTGSGEFYTVICPICQEVKGLDYKKRKLYIASDLSWGFCQRCRTLFKDPAQEFRSPHISNSGLMTHSIDSEVNVYTSMKKYVNASEKMSDRSRNYLMSRNPHLVTLWNEFSMRCDSDGIYIPYPNYDYYIRANFDRSEKKYYLPPTPEKPAFIINRNSSYWIVCEGVFDALAISLMNPTDSIMAVTGSTMTRPQLNHFRSLLPQEVLIYLDETRLSIDLRNQISPHLGSAYVDIIESDGEDPEEYYIKRFIK